MPPVQTVVHIKSRSVLDRLYRLLNQRRVYHPLFWLVLFAVMVGTALNANAEAGMPVAAWFIVGNEAISLAFFIILVYVNLTYLVPRYLAHNVLTYIALVLGLCALLAPIRALIFYFRFSGLPASQYNLIQNQHLIFISHVSVTALSTVLRVIMDWWRYQNEKQQLVTQTMQSELRFLKSQINPHFLFNTLNNLYALTLKKSDKAPEIVLKLSEIMRYMLYECNEKRVQLVKEIQYIHNYLDLERLRQPAGTEITFTTEGRISEQLVAPLLFVPFLENSFKHGLNHHVSGNGFVRLHLRVQDEDLEFTIENSKPERLPRQEHARSGGIGLANVRQRLKLLYPENHALEMQDEPHRYAVTLHLKLI